MPFFTLSLSGKILFTNDASKLIFEKNPDENKYFYEWIGIDAEQFATDISEEIISKGFLSKTNKVTIGEKQKIFQTNYSLLLDEINEPFGMAVFVNEITELAELSDGFAKIGTLHTALVNGMNQSLLVFDKHHLLFFNSQAYNYFSTRFEVHLLEGLSIEEAIFFYSKNRA